VGGALASLGRGEMYREFFVGKYVGKRLLGKSRHRLKDNIRMDFIHIGWQDVD
jgi:hypothetical protein